MDRKSVMVGSLLLFFAVALGAFGAHGLRDKVEPEALTQWKTAVEYQFYHGLAILLLAALPFGSETGRLRTIRALFVAGILLFSGSIYLLAIRDVLGIQWLTPVLGPITPLGGLFFMAGWAMLFITAARKGDDR